jgi:glycosyltransferase involved in cell wall biosynthesis
MRRVLIALEVGDAYPSGLVRGLVYKDMFARRGYQATFVNRMDPVLEKCYTRKDALSRKLLAAGGGGALKVTNRLIGRLGERRIIRKARDVDVVYLLKTNSYRLVQRLRRSTRARLVFDLNDGLWLPRFSRFAGGRLLDILRSVDAVTSDNEYGCDYARQYNQHVYMVPEHPQLELFEAQRSHVRKNPDEVVIGWIGSPATAYNLFAIWEPLESLFARHPHITLRLVGVGYDPTAYPRFEKVRFSTLPFYEQAQMVHEVLHMDIGVFPLFDVEDSVARGIMKATIYMSGGAAVVASGIGASTRLIADGRNGMLARSGGEWLEKLELLVTQPNLRRAVADGGLALMREDYNIERSFSRLEQALLGT